MHAGLLRAYVDETGDRGVSPSASRFFSMAAVVVADEHDAALRASVNQLRSDFKVPSHKPLHWQEHVKVYARRQHVTRVLSAVPSVSLNYVVFEKSSIPSTAVLRMDTAKFYNFVAGLTLERILLTAAYWPGGARGVHVRFGHVRGFNHTDTANYFAYKRQLPECNWLRWDLLQSVKFEDAGKLLGLQAADQFAGMLHVAMNTDPYGGHEPHHLLSVRHLIRRNGSGRAMNYGFKCMVGTQTLASYPWWPQGGI